MKTKIKIFLQHIADFTVEIIKEAPTYDMAMQITLTALSFDSYLTDKGIYLD